MTPLEAWLSRQPTWVLLAYVFLAVPVLWAAALADRIIPVRIPTEDDAEVAEWEALEVGE